MEMVLPEILYLLVGAGVVCCFGLFASVSIGENKTRAAVLSGLFAVVYGVVWFGIFILRPMPEAVLYGLTGVILLGGLMFFLPLGRTSFLVVGDITEKIDERDVIFSREEYLPGSIKYDEYYGRHPELNEIDDRIRRLPGLLEPGGRFYDPVSSSYTSSIFDVIEKLGTEVDGSVNSERIEMDTAEATISTKEMTRHLGAAEVGIAALNPAFVYTHVGRGPEKWGAQIDNKHHFAIVFALEMDYDYVEQAPRAGITEESAREYLQGAMISLALARYIRRLGYPARAHISGSNYQIMLPPVAHDAGLGELGRFGYLISPRYGARVRLGAVTTDLPLLPDSPIKFGVQEFCEICKRCAVNCPSASIPDGAKTKVNGVEKWPLEIESCMMYWRAIGTDCGLCMKVCPFSHPDNFMHNLVRSGIKNSAVARWLSVRGEDIFYGRKAGI
ncbi:MAG: reductive dehalogenase [FCB group bacterium]|nr:reductive dehalogenase [FCB group bacterium]